MLNDPISDESSMRRITIAGGSSLEKNYYPSNKVSSANYSTWSLVPQNLFEQMQRSSNLFFLVISVFQLLPFNLNPTDSWSTVAPLAILITFTLIKDAYNDYYRHKEDQKINKALVQCWDGESFAPIPSKTVRVGNILQVQEGEMAPADLLILLVGGGTHTCYVDEGNLYGASDLLTKGAIEETQRHFEISDRAEPILKKFRPKILVGQPSADFQLRGFLEMPGFPKKIEFSHKEVLMRGSTFQGAPWLIGIAIYTGRETKTQMNNSRTARKTSAIEKDVNYWVLGTLVVLLVLVLFSLMGYFFLSTSEWNELSVVEAFVVFTLLYNNIIPISLFVVMDIVRILQLVLIQNTTGKKVSFKTGDVNEDLGQIEYIFADKTGTLTEHSLRVHTCIVNGQRFSRDISDVEDRSNITILEDKMLLADEPKPEGYYDFGKLGVLSGENHVSTFHFLRCMTICNNIITNADVQLLGTSPEERALTEAAAELGLRICQKDENHCSVENLDRKENYVVMGVNPFTSENRRSHILVQKENSTFLYVKGAIDAMAELMNAPRQQLEMMDTYLEELKGKRVLVLAYKELHHREAEEIAHKIESAKIAIINKEQRISSIFQNYEQGLTFLGVIGIQEEVRQETRDTVKYLTEAGIKMWLVSGDTHGSVHSAAFNAGLIDPSYPEVSLKNIDNMLQCVRTLTKNFSIHVLNEVDQSRPSLDPEPKFEEEGDVSGIMKDNNKAEAMLSQHPFFSEISKGQSQGNMLLHKEFNYMQVKYYVSMDRISFRTAITDPDMRRLLLSLLLAADFVICHSFLPRDKRDLLRIIKESYKFKPVTLAVGDGNNDIPMLQEAHVGVGINSGVSLQAKYYSEIVISHFSDLKELLLVHGHWNYSRMARTVLLFLYKNFILTVVFFFYIYVSDFSGTSVFDAGLLVGYNIFFTTLPVLVMGIMDEDMPAEELRAKPEVYSDGYFRRYFSLSKLLKYSGLAIIHGVVLMIIFFYSTGRTTNEDGQTSDFFILGTSLYIGTVLVVLIQITIDTYKISVSYIVSVVLSLLFFLVYLIIISAYDLFDGFMSGIGDDLLDSSLILLIALMTPLICFIISYAIIVVPPIFYPQQLHRVAELTVSKVPQRLEAFATGMIKALKLVSTSNIDGISNEAYEMKKYSLIFKSQYIEKEYRANYILENIRFYQFLICFFEVLLVLWTFFEALLFDADLTFTLLRVILSVAFGVVVLMTFTDHYRRHYILYNLLVIYVGIISKYILYFSFTRAGVLAAALIPSVTYILFNEDFLKISYANILNLILLLFELILYTVNTDEEDFTFNEGMVYILSNMALVIAITITSACVGYTLEKSRRTEYKLITQKEISLVRTANILGFLLPSFVRKRVKEGIRYIAEDKGTVTVVFCDICDFDKICAEYTPLEFTTFLDSLFKDFDQLCISAGVSKIETVGKTYMACAGLTDFESDIEQDLKEISQVRRAMEFAIGLILHVQEVKLKNGESLKVKIGINSGPVTAGVVGFHKPQFSLVGDTVNTASRMCSTLERYNGIQITERTYEMLDDHRGLTFEKTSVEAKGKGLMTTYLVSESKSFGQTETLVIKGSVRAGSNSLINSESEDRSNVRSLANNLGSSLEIEKNKDSMSNMNIINCKCQETEQMKELRQSKMQKNSEMIRLSIFVAVITYTVLSVIAVLEVYVLDDPIGNLATLILKICCVIVLLTELLLFKKIYMARWYAWLVILLLNVLLYSSLLYIILDEDRWNDLVTLEVIYVILLLNYSSGATIQSIIRGSLLFFIPWLTLFFFNDESATIHAANSMFLIGFAIINTSAVMSREKQLRIYTDLHKMAEKEINRTNELLQQMMPPHVVENMRQGKGTTDKLYNVTMLYADIVGFTNWSSGKTPTQVVEMLSEMFTEFDKKCGTHNVYKVHTIGDCYVVMGNTESNNRDPAQECCNVLDMAFSMIQIIQNINSKHNSELNMRIGLHTGEVIAGITGTNIVRYDIYGPDVLIANKMESGGEAGRVNVSDITRSILEVKEAGKYAYSDNKLIEAKAVERKHPSFFIKPAEENQLS